MIITIAGKPGSGKSTVAKLLAHKLNYALFSAGDLRGQIAMQHGLTIDQLNELGKKERWTDEECDKLIERMGKEQNNIIFDSRLAWHFIPNSVKLFLDVNLHEAAQRIFKKQRPDEKHQESVQGVYTMITQRIESDIARYKKWYNVDILDLKNYDVVIDTTQLTQEQTLKKILAHVTKKQDSSDCC